MLTLGNKMNTPAAMGANVPRFAIVTILLYCLAVSIVDAAPYQELEPRPGHVPVYIRYGNTPLSEIHPKLAEAFREIESDSLKLEGTSVAESKQETENVGAKSAEDGVTAKDAELRKDASDESLAEIATSKKEPADKLVGEVGAEKEANENEADETNSTKESDIASFEVVKATNADFEVPKAADEDVSNEGIKKNDDQN